MRKRVNVDRIVAKQQAVAEANKAKKRRFYELQRELYGLEVELVMIAYPQMSEWDAVQRVYNAHRYNLVSSNNTDALYDDNLDEKIARAKAEEKIAKEQQFRVEKNKQLWTELCAKVKSLSSNDEDNIQNL